MEETERGIGEGSQQMESRDGENKATRPQEKSTDMHLPDSSRKRMLESQDSQKMPVPTDEVMEVDERDEEDKTAEPTTYAHAEEDERMEVDQRQVGVRFGIVVLNGYEYVVL